MEDKNKIEHQIVETYAEDMARVIDENKDGLVKKIIQGEEQHEEEKRNLSPESKKNKLFMFLGTFLIVIGVAMVTFLFFFRTHEGAIPVEKQFIPIIFNDKTVFVPIDGLTRDEIIQTVLTEATKVDQKEGGVKGIYLTENKELIGLRKFLTVTKSNFAPGDNTIFVSDNFLLGVVSSTIPAEAGKNNFFILLGTRGIADIFDSLRAWEEKMLSDLHKFLEVNVTNENNYLLTKGFEDSVIENKNTRVLYDKDGNIILSYIFADNNSVLITASPSAAREIILRLASREKVQ